MKGTRRVRVVRLVPELDFGGVESRVTLQAALMDRARFDLRICTFWKAGAAARQIGALGVPVDVLDRAPVRSASTLLSLTRYLRAIRPDVLHCSVTEANFLGLSAGLAARVPVRIAEEVGIPEHGLRARLAFMGLYSTASAVIGVTQAVSDYLVEVDRAPRHRVQRIYNCAHPRYFPEPRKSLERTDSQRATFLVVGRLHPIKNHETLLRAFARVASRRPEARLLIAGDGPLRDGLDTLRRELGIAERSEMLGFHANVAELVQTSGAFVLGSHAEGCSIALIEAMAGGLPALGSRVSGIREVMGEGLAGDWTVDTTDVDGWARMMDAYLALDPSRRTALAARAQERAYEQFSPTRYIDDLGEVYGRLLSSADAAFRTPRHTIDAGLPPG